MAEVILEYLRVFISWPFLVFVLLLVARKEVTRVLDELAKRLTRAEVGGQIFEFQKELQRVEKRVTQKVDENTQAVERKVQAAQKEIQNLQGFFLALDDITEAEARVPEGYKRNRDRVFNDYRKRLDNMSEEQRAAEQEMFTRSYLKKFGVTLTQVKQALKNVGAYDGDIDELFDSSVGDAIRAFQVQNGLEPDGIFGTLTYKKLSTFFDPGTSGSNLK
jgi:murein L,D-transpeptidase YcbB/YkuD